jgi:hypothetical protein
MIIKSVRVELFLHVSRDISLSAPDKCDSLRLLLSWKQSLDLSNDVPKRDLDAFDAPGLALVAIFSDKYSEIPLRFLRRCWMRVN